MPHGYESLPYPSRSYKVTHPDHLAVIGRLFGLSPAPIESCRVLELGCASGDNLIPMAFQLPSSRFLGIDLSPHYVEQGRSAIEGLGLRNIELRQGDILDLDVSIGPFDYILCHGLFSWVPEASRQKILSLCRECLTEQGIATVSYNVYPGWHVAQVLRTILRYHVDEKASAREQVAQARELLAVMKDVPVERKSYGNTLQTEITILEQSEDGYLFWEYLVGDNQPFLFHEFSDLARDHGLTVLGDAEQSTLVVDQQPEPVAGYLRTLANVTQAQQYLDFFLNRTFRLSLLCHAERPVDMVVTPDRAEGLAVRALFDFVPVDEQPDGQPRTTITNAHGNRAELVGQPMRFALDAIYRDAPQAVPIRRLMDMAQEQCWEPHEDRSGTPVEPWVEHLPGHGRWRAGEGTLAEPWVELLRQDLASQLIGLFFGGLVDLVTRPVPVLSEVPRWPRVSALVRRQAESAEWVTNQWHQVASLDTLARQIVLLLDGTRTIDDIVAALSTSSTASHLARLVSRLPDPEWSLEDAVNQVLCFLRDGALLVP